MKDSLRLLKPFLRGFPLILLSMIIAGMLAGRYLTYTTPQFESSVKIKLADLNEGVPSANLFKDFDVFSSSTKIAAEIELIKSAVLLNKALDSLNFDIEVYRVGDVMRKEIYQDNPLIISSVGSTLKTATYLFDVSGTFVTFFSESEAEIASGRLGDTISVNDHSIVIEHNSEIISQRPNIDVEGRYAVKLMSRADLLEQVKHNIDVMSSDKDVPVVSITYKSPVPAKSAAFVNRLAQTYISDYIESKFKAANVTVDFLDDRINKVAKDLAASESAIESYKSRKGIINLRQETETDLRKIAQLKIQQTNLKGSLDAIQDLESYLKANQNNFTEMAPNFEAFNDLLSTELVKKIKLLQAEKKDLLLDYTPENAKVQVIDRKLDDLSSYLLESVSNTKRNLERKYNDLGLDIEEAEFAFVGLPTKEKTLNILNRDFAIYQNSYNFLNEKRIEAEIAQAARVAFHRIITPALPSSHPVSPNRPIILIVSVLLAFILSVALIYTVHEMKGKVNDRQNIEQLSNTPIALFTPFIKTNSEVEDVFLKHAHRLELKGLAHENSVIAISGKTSHEGQSFHTQHLAACFTAQGKKVAVLTDGLKSSENYDTVSYAHLANSVTSKSDIDQFVDSLREAYDIVLIENQPIDNERIAKVLMKSADTNLYVLDSRKTPAKHIEEVDELFKEYSIPGPHFVLNRDQYNPNVALVALRFAKQFIGEKLGKA